MAGLWRALRAHFLDSRAKHAGPATQRASVCEPMNLLRPQTRAHWVAGSSPAMVEGFYGPTVYPSDGDTHSTG